MQIVDTHVHVWTHSPEFPRSSDSVELPPIDAYPQALLDVMTLNGVEWAVLVHHIAYGWDNSYASYVQKSFPSKFLAVCRVNPNDLRAPDHLSYWTEVHGFRGMRLSPSPDKRDDWFTNSSMIPLFRRANELKVPILILTQPSRLIDLISILERVPETCIVLDHMADCINGNSKDLDQLLSLAKYPHLFLKMSHVSIHSSHEQTRRATRSFLKQVYETYGASRIMWGSDWPLCLNKTTYPQAISHVREEMDFLTTEDLEWIYRKTALRLWPFTDGK